MSKGIKEDLNPGTSLLIFLMDKHFDLAPVYLLVS
jgi:hypothetical protein